jgi:hypothetical protein
MITGSPRGNEKIRSCKDQPSRTHDDASTYHIYKRCIKSERSRNMSGAQQAAVLGDRENQTLEDMARRVSASWRPGGRIYA